MPKPAAAGALRPCPGRSQPTTWKSPREQGGAARPERLGRGAERRAEQQQRPAGRRRASGDRRSAWRCPGSRGAATAPRRSRLPRWRRGSVASGQGGLRVALGDRTPLGASASCRRAARVAAIRSASTCRPSSSSAVCDAGHHGAPGQGAQGGPLDVPGAVGPLVDGVRRGRVQGRGQRRRRPARRGGPAPASTGFCLLGMVDEPPRPSAAAPRPARRSRARLPSSTSLAILPQASVQVTNASADAGERGCGRCATGRRTGRPRCAAGGPRPATTGPLAGEPARAVGAARLPAAPPICIGRARGRRRGRRRASRTPCSQPAALSAEGGRDGVLGEGAAGHRGAAVPVGEPGQRARPGGAGRRGRRSTVGAQAEHERGVEHVLAGQAAVQPRGAVGGRRRARGAARPAGSPGCRRPRPSTASASAGRLGPTRPCRSAPRVRGRRVQGGQPGRLDPTIAASDARVGEQVAGAGVAGPEQVGHAQTPRCLGIAEEHRLAVALQADVEDAGRCASRVVISVSRRSGGSDVEQRIAADSPRRPGR